MNTNQGGGDGEPQHPASPRTTLSPRQLDRAAGVLLGAACGDALGVPYEFGRRLSADEKPAMIGGGLGPYAPGEYSDDTQMAACIAQVAAAGADLRTEDALDAIAEGFLDWKAGGASDIGAQTSAVLSAARHDQAVRPAEALRQAARALHARTGRTAGNGSLMRTGVVALAYLDDVEALAAAARAVSDLTHPDPLAGDACVLWCAAIRHAVLHATFDGMHEGLALIPEERRDRWASWISEAETADPGRFSPNGFVVPALQAAWSAITQTPVPAEDPAAGSFACQHLQDALAAAVRIGNDTDTVAAIAGALLGARWGASAVPVPWLRIVHGWPGLRAPDLIRLAALTASGGRDDERGWPSLTHRPLAATRVTQAAAHPCNDGVILGSLGVSVPDAGAVVSLCQVGREDFAAVPAGDHIEVWLVDHPGDNNQPRFVIDQAARAVAQLRSEGKRVFLHCWAAQSRTPAVAARYAAISTGTSPADAFSEVCAALGSPQTLVNPELRAAVYELAGQHAPVSGPDTRHPGWMTPGL
jgi:ADP-ribosylglycohydrolase